MRSRRDFLKSSGALIVSFSAGALTERPIAGQGPFDTHPSHIDPKKLDSWLAVGADGSVTAYTGKCDFGQGIFTAQTQLVAEELGVPIGRVRLIQCDTAVTPDQGTTSGSQSTPTNFNSANLALAAATAREALLSLAAQKLVEPIGSLRITADGAVAAASGRKVTYVELIGGKHFNLTVSLTARRRTAPEWTVLGKPVPSLDRTALMTGQFEFVHAVRVPGMLHGRVVRPPEMGATLASVDRNSVRHIPGVTIVVRKDFVGVVAEKQHDAVLAARQLSVRWNPGAPLPPQAGFFEHMQKLPSRDTLSVDSGDVERQLAAAGPVMQARYTYPYQMHGSVGASCAVADVKAGSATVWSATQSVYPTRSIVARLLNIPLESVRVIYTRGSGCYGLNGADAVSFDAAVLSQALGKPVRLQFSREDEMRWENLGAACVVEHRAALGPDGNIAAWDRANWVPSLGNRPGYDTPGNVISGVLAGYQPDIPAPGPATVPRGRFQNQSNHVPAYFAGCVGQNVDGACAGGGTVRSERALTHTVRSPFFTGPLRSPLRIQNTFANECFMDELCAQAKADPVAFRLRHLSDGRVAAVIQAAAKASKWIERPFPAVSPRQTGMATGRGIACVNYEGGNGFAALVAEVAVNLDTGSVRPTRFVVAIDCGPVSNPDGLRNQTEGGILQGMSRALVEEVAWDAHRITSIDWKTYNSLHLDYEMPAIECVFVTPDGVPATGAGETAITVTPAAIGNAIFDATGARLRNLPFTPDRVKSALREARSTASA